MPLVNVKLLKPLDGKAEGDFAEFERVDAARLVGLGAVEIVGEFKQAVAPLNKMQPAPVNKVATVSSAKTSMPRGE